MNSSLSATRPSLRWLATGLVAGLLTAALAGPGIVAAQDEPPVEGDVIPTITVSGVGRVMAAPDVADINLGVTEQAKEAADAAAKASAAMNAIVDALLAAGIDENDIQTTTLSLSPVYDWEDSPPNIEAWEATNLVNVTVRDIEAVGPVVDAATAAGATNISGISFRVEDPTEAEAAARTRAVADARAKAEQLAGEAGVTISGILTITETSDQPPQPFYLERAEMAVAADAAAPTPVMPGEVELSVRVSIQFRIA